MRHHTATHLLQNALKRIVGKHITQSGSSVSPQHLRFDFTHVEPLSDDQLQQIEIMVNQQIMLDSSVKCLDLPLEEAKKIGAIAPFGEKYGAHVRVIQIQDFSLEFCGGTHLDRTGKIGSFFILSESSIASGVRRIEAVAGMQAFQQLLKQRNIVTSAANMLSAPHDEILQRIQSLDSELKSLRRSVKELRQSLSSNELNSVLQKPLKVKGIPIFVHKFNDLDMPDLRNLIDILKSKTEKFIAVLGSAKDNKVSLVCSVSHNLQKKIPANSIIKDVAKIVGGSGGGRPNLAQAGGKLPGKLDDALASVADIVRNHLKS
jgi:alanyl-tRNA synthetase